MDRSGGGRPPARADVFVTGPFPPPVHGMAVATERLAARLGERFDVRRFDIGTGVSTGIAVLDALRRALAAGGTLAALAAAMLRRRPRAVIVALSTGFAKGFDLSAIAVALGLGRTVYVSHHSFATFDGRLQQRLLDLCRPMLRRCRHIVLCDLMKSALCESWQIAPDRVLVLSNAGLTDLPPGAGDGAPSTRGSRPAMLRIGFIANLSADKGLWTFLDVVQHVQSQGCAVTALIAGPVAPPDARLERNLRKRLRQMTGVEWLGAVHGERRTAFYRAIDWLILPTVYRHEAEPLVILEALAHGVPVMTTRRGCIASALADGASVLALDEARFVSGAAAAISAAGRDASAGRSSEAVGHYERLRAAGLAHFEILAAQIGLGEAVERR